MTPADLRTPIANILAEYEPVAAAYLFGSYARGNATQHSDLDIGIVFRRRGDSALTHHRLIGDLANRLERLVPAAKADVVVLEGQSPIFQHRVLAEGRLVYEADRERRIDFESDAHVRYFDWKPTYEIARRRHRAGFRRWLNARREQR